MSRASVPALLLPALWAFAAPVTAQSVRVGDPEEAYLRILQLSGVAETPSFTVRPISRAAARASIGSAAHPWALRVTSGGARPSDPVLRAGDARVRGWRNSTYPRGGNDGAVWQGRGVTVAAEAQASFAWRGLSGTFNPLVMYNENGAFGLAPPTWAGATEYAYPWRQIDWPQRFGPDAFSTFDLGQSQLAFDWKGGRVSVGNENLSWGPALENPIVMSANAPGFLHASLGTNRPVDIGIGTLEGSWIWGGLAQSDWFDPTLADTGRFLTGIVLTYNPSFLDGLSLGGTRVFQELVPEGGLPLEDYFLVFQGLLKEGQVSADQPTGTDESDQILSVFGRWAFPASGFEAYVEWARTDHSWNREDFLREPEHSSAYTLGFQKVTAFSADRAFVLRSEITRLESSPTFQVRPRVTYYVHGVTTQGYTHKGQILGSQLGPGGNGQSIAFDWYEGWGMASFQVARRVHDNDAYWVWAEANDEIFTKHHVSFDLGGRALYFLNDFDLGAGVVFTREWSRNFYGRKTTNWNVSLSARWRPFRY